MMNQLMCLAAAIFFEARDQPHFGQRAVAEVVMTRVESPRWPDTICGVVYQRKQFSFTHDGLSDDYKGYDGNMFDSQAIVIAEEIANSYIKGERLGLTSTHYYATYISAPKWTKLYHADGRIGGHLFFTATEGN